MFIRCALVPTGAMCLLVAIAVTAACWTDPANFLTPIVLTLVLIVAGLGLTSLIVGEPGTAMMWASNIATVTIGWYLFVLTLAYVSST